MTQQHLIQERIKEIMRKWYVTGMDNGLEQAHDIYNDKKPLVVDVQEIEKEMQSESDELVASAKREVIEEMEKKIEKLYSGFEDNKPVVFASISEQHYNQGLYQGRLNAMEIVTQDLFGINGDELKSTISSLKESLPANTEKK